MSLISSLTTDIGLLGNHEKAHFLQRFFKTGPGEYAENDIFLGVIVPEVRKVAKKYTNQIKKSDSIPRSDLEESLHSPFHEVRLATLLILAELFKNPSLQHKIAHLCLSNTAYINNRDLVDVTMPNIIGAYYFDKDRSDLYKLAKSDLLRDRRISIVSTFYFIKHGQHADTFQVAEILLHDSHDLIHKATGWMLREVGKRIDENLLKSFLDLHVHQMPRAMLRYAIEKFPEKTRLYYLKK